jgi:endoglucanase
LLWGAAWLRRATQGDNFLNYIQSNGKTLGAEDNINEFGWDNKHAGLNVLVSKVTFYSISILLFIIHFIKHYY